MVAYSLEHQEPEGLPEYRDIIISIRLTVHTGTIFILNFMLENSVRASLVLLLVYL